MKNQEIIAESSATRIAISALVSTVREMFYSHVYDAKHRDRKVINTAIRSYNKFYSEFDKMNIADNVFYDSLLDKFQTHAVDMAPGETYQERRNIFAIFVSVIDYVCKEYAESVIFTDKYIVYHISLITKQLARQFANQPTEEMKNHTVDLLNHFEERRQEIKKIILENYEMSEVSEENKPEDLVDKLPS